jgi:D-alanyl-D-alanine carboxypeptidase
MWEKIKNHKDVFLVIGVFIFIASIKPVFSEFSFKEESAGLSLENLSAKAVFVLDKNKDAILHEENSDQVFEIASITKIMTALIAMEEIPNKGIVIDRDSYLTVGDTGLLIDEKWPLENLVTFMLTNSSNDAAEALAKNHPRGREKFIERMNDRARELGLESLHFLNPTGLNETEEYGGIGSAKDVAALFDYTYQKYPDIFQGTKENDFLITSFDAEHLAENTNLAASSLLGLTAGKTGFTDKAGGSLVTRIDLGLGYEITAVIVGTETREERFEDMKKIIQKSALSYIK